MIILLFWLTCRKRKTPAPQSEVSRNNRQTGPAWEQDTPWVLDLDSIDPESEDF